MKELELDDLIGAGKGKMESAGNTGVKEGVAAQQIECTEHC